MTPSTNRNRNNKEFYDVIDSEEWIKEGPNIVAAQ
jgi:hypothetical protein